MRMCIVALAFGTAFLPAQRPAGIGEIGFDYLQRGFAAEAKEGCGAAVKSKPSDSAARSCLNSALDQLRKEERDRSAQTHREEHNRLAQTVAQAEALETAGKNDEAVKAIKPVIGRLNGAERRRADKILNGSRPRTYTELTRDLG